MSYTFTPAADADPAAVVQLELDLAAVRAPKRPARGRMETFESRGRKALETGRGHTGKQRATVRVAYRSQGGEWLEFAAGPMSFAEADRLKWDLRAAPMANARIMRDYETGPRFVTLPSQVADGVVGPDVADAEAVAA